MLTMGCMRSGRHGPAPHTFYLLNIYNPKRGACLQYNIYNTWLQARVPAACRCVPAMQYLQYLAAGTRACSLQVRACSTISTILGVPAIQYLQYLAAGTACLQSAGACLQYNIYNTWLQERVRAARRYVPAVQYLQYLAAGTRACSPQVRACNTIFTVLGCRHAVPAARRCVPAV